MRFVVDGFPIRVGSAGVGTYTMELLGALVTFAPEHEYYLADFGPRLAAARIPSGLTASDYDAHIGALVARVPLPWKAVPFRLRRALTRVEAAHIRADVYLGTNFLGVFHPSFKTVITVHDLSHVHYPHSSNPFMYRKLRRDLADHASRAHAILTDSVAMQHVVRAHFNVPAAKVHVVHGGVSDRFRPCLEEGPRERCRRRYSLPRRFLLCVGTVEPRKNVPRLLEAFGLLTEDPSFQHSLVVVGARGWRDEAIRKALVGFPRKERLVTTGRVEREDLPVLYSMADALVYPSLYEGFGLPVLEAMACGTPVITSTVSSLPEIAGNAALLVDPESVQQIATAMARLVRDGELAASLRRRGLTRATAFSWDASARKVLELCDRIVTG